MNRKKVFITLGCILVLLFVVGVSYAYWGLTFTQSENNVVTTDCFEVEFLEGRAIQLNKAYPVSDEEGLKNEPYTFTIKNVCESSADYQINLETLTPNGKKLPDHYLKANLMERSDSKITTKLESGLSIEPTIEGAVDAYKLFTGTLSPKEEKTFELRLWMHSDVTADMEDSMNAEYNGKVTIVTSYEKASAVLAGLKIPLVEEGNGLYMVSHSDAEITYTSDEIAINNLKQTEYRYAGKSPDNYVNFNNELWRIIGLVNTPEGQRVKLIRNESIGGYSWDSSESNINIGYGVGEWSTSDMMELLNHGAYYNRTSGICFNGEKNATTECDFSESGLTNNAKGMIDTITWNLGSNDGTIYQHNNINTNNFYNLERSNNSNKICSSDSSYCNDTVPRTNTWVGSVGLMYPSDYGYATSGGTTTDRATCLNTLLYSWNASECEKNDWLYKEGVYQWTLTTLAISTNANDMFTVNSSGNVTTHYAYHDYVSLPSIYLKESVKIESGSGTIDLPYNLKI